jgi:SnoaL-like domain
LARTTALLLIVAALAGCGSGGAASPESVVRTWSQALNRGDDEAAASLFAHGARAVQGRRVFVLRTREDAIAWNRGLPCSGRIVSLHRHGDLVTATFLLGRRPGHSCDGPGAEATALFRVDGGKIVLWHQTGSQGLPAPV